MSLLKGQLITTKRGYVPIEDIRPGDFVYTESGNYRRVDSLIETPYSGEVLEIKANGFFMPITCTPNHKLVMYRGKKEYRGVNNLRHMEVKNIHENDFFVYKLESHKKFAFDGIGLDLTDTYKARFLGYYAMDGFIDWEKGKVAIHIDKMKKSYDDIVESCEKGFGLTLEKYLYMGEEFLGVNSEYLCNLCKDFGDTNKTRVLPEYIMSATDEFLLSFVQPFLVLSQGKSYFRPSGSMGFLMAYQRIFLRLNAFSNLYRCISKDREFVYYALTLIHKEVNSIGLPRDTWFKKEGLTYIKVESIFKATVKDVKVYDLIVDGGESYCNHFIMNASL